VSKPGRYNSYTKNIKNAQKFRTKEEAERNKCGNEYIVNTYTELD
jgi:hypothetical protein